jgi:hypothetical protein
LPLPSPPLQATTSNNPIPSATPTSLRPGRAPPWLTFPVAATPDVSSAWLRSCHD